MGPRHPGLFPRRSPARTVVSTALPNPRPPIRPRGFYCGLGLTAQVSEDRSPTGVHVIAVDEGMPSQVLKVTCSSASLKPRRPQCRRPSRPRCGWLRSPRRSPVGAAARAGAQRQGSARRERRRRPDRGRRGPTALRRRAGVGSLITLQVDRVEITGQCGDRALVDCAQHVLRRPANEQSRPRDIDRNDIDPTAHVSDRLIGIDLQPSCAHPPDST
jgi:hypothetical protein